MKLIPCLLIAALACAAHTHAEETRRVVLVGDSTVATRTGWGDGFIKLLKPGVEGNNLARGGRSSKSYRDEGWWKKALAEKPTWVLIQFGHNDQPGKGPDRETDPKTTFRDNLKRYVNEARNTGAKPVLVTPLTRRNFNAQGKIDPQHLVSATDGRSENSPDILTAYAEGARAVAMEEKVPLIDLNARSVELMNKIGPKAAAAFDARTSGPKPDKTHLSKYGEAETAKLVAGEIRRSVPDLAELLTP